MEPLTSIINHVINGAKDVVDGVECTSDILKAISFCGAAVGEVGADPVADIGCILSGTRVYSKCKTEVCRVADLYHKKVRGC